MAQEEEEEEVEYVDDEDVDFPEEEDDMEDLEDPAALNALPAATAKRKQGELLIYNVCIWWVHEHTRSRLL